MPLGFLRNTHRSDGSGGNEIGSPIISLRLVFWCCVDGIVCCRYGIVARWVGGNFGFACGGNWSTMWFHWDLESLLWSMGFGFGGMLHMMDGGSYGRE